MKGVDNKSIIKSLKIATKEDIDFLFDLGISYHKEHDLHMTLLIFNRITELSPKYIDAWINKGYALVDLGKHEEAIKCFDQVLRINENDADTWSDKGASLGSLMRYSEALDCIDKSIKLNKKNPNAIVNKAIIFVNLGKYKEAVKLCERAINLNPNHFESRFCMGDALSRLKKYEEAIESYNKALCIKPDDRGILINISNNFINIKKYTDAIECCNKVIDSDKNIGVIEAYVNKGIALSKIEKFLEAIECFDKSIELDPNFDKAWYNKALTLISLENYDNAIKCFDYAIQIEPNFPEAYANKGIALAILRKYDDAEEEFKMANSLFSNNNKAEEYEKMKKLIELVSNSKEIVDRFKPLDERFLDSLNSNTLTDLKNKIDFILKDIENFYEIFQNRIVSEDVNELLVNKQQCLIILSKALDFDFIDRSQLLNAKSIFEKWGLIDYIVAINSLDSFIMYLQNYKSIKDIPPSMEQRLLIILKNLHILDGKLTQEIRGDFKAELYGQKMTNIGKAISLSEIPIPLEITNEYIRVCLIQLDINLSKRFPYELLDADVIKNKIISALNIAKQENVNIVCLPELSISKCFLEYMKKFKDMIIIAGSYYENNFNICPVVFNGDIYSVFKINPSPYFEYTIAPNKGMSSGNQIKLFNLKKSKFSVLICLDYLKESNNLCGLSGNNENDIKFIFNPSCNSDVKRFQRRANSDCENYHMDILQVNIKKYGGTCIIGIEHKNYIDRMINEGYRMDDDINYKICEANDEMMIIADISTKGVEIPTHVNAKPRIRIHSGYIYTNNSWQEKLDPWWNNS